VGMPVEVRLDAMPSHGLAGTVFSVRPNVDPAKATAIAKVHLSETAKDEAATADAGLPRLVTLFPGMNGRVNFLTKALDPQTMNTAPKLEVAASAVSTGDKGPSVLTLGSNGRLQSVPVVIGGTDGDRVILKEGPAAGTLVVQNPEGLKPGRRAKPQQ
jgi:hypothetical protein